VEVTVSYSSCWEALRFFGVDVLTLSNSPKPDPRLEALCTPYRHALESFLSMPLDVALRLSCKRWAIAFWLTARRLDSTSLCHKVQLREILERWWLPAISTECTLPERGYHSIDHLVQTALAAAYIARREGANPILAALAGLLHDSARNGDEDGAGHAGRAISLLQRSFGSALSSLFSPDDLRKLRVSIARHASGRSTNDPNIGACWDADRLRLAWERGADSGYFSTSTGWELACSPPQDVLTKFEAEFGPGVWKC
jgi:hypothetical protein